MKRNIILFYLLAVCVSVQAQFREQVFVHTDKNSYLAGEDMWVKLFVTDEANHPTVLSKVGYVELCNTERSHVQLKIALENGAGWGKVRIPVSIPTGIYRLTGYTRYMRNGGEDVFFKKQIAIVNTFAASDADRFETTQEKQEYVKPINGDRLSVFSDKALYEVRSKVKLTLQNLPKDAKDMVLSVYRDDAFALPAADCQPGKKGGAYSDQWLPEYEGHIVTARLVGKEGSNISIDSVLSAGISFVGKDIRLTYGQKQANGTVLFYTSGIYGPQETSVSGISLYGTPLRLDLTSPFVEKTPKELPLLQLYPDKEALQERSIGVQLQQVMIQDSVGVHLLSDKFYNISPVLSYDLDEYTRFASIRETFIEFIWRIHLTKINNETVMQVLCIDTKKYSIGKALVMLDGVPIYDHEAMLAYNPYLLKRIDIFDGKYMFGGEVYDSMISFISKQGRLSGIRLGDESQLVTYDCPHWRDSFEMPDYDAVVQPEWRKPDYRHTLYWNPEVKPDNRELSFFTSDLSGRFRAVIEAVTADGQMISGSYTFEVK